MEKVVRELIQEVSESNQELRQLYDKHIKLDREVERLGRYAPYSHAAAIKHQELKKEKLRDMDIMMSILKDYRDAVNA